MTPSVAHPDPLPALGDEACQHDDQATLPSSDGWKLKKPIWIQRFEPRTSAATTKTTSRRTSVSP